MKILPSILLALGVGALFAGSAAAVPMGSFSCASGDSSSLCGWGEQGLSADLRDYRRGSAILTITMSGGPSSVDLEDVFLDCQGGDVPQLRRLWSFGSFHSYQVSYSGSFDRLLDRVHVGVELGYRHHRRTFWGHHGSPVPEPSAAVLFAIGAATLGFSLRRALPRPLRRR
jgi:hypothetical protein